VLWTHVYDADGVRGNPVSERLGEAEPAEVGGFRHHVHRHSYGWETRLPGFWGGTHRHSNWLPREDLLGALAHFGWQDVEIAFDEPRNPNGPALALVARRSRSTG
jgi:hypothetical protein